VDGNASIAGVVTPDLIISSPRPGALQRLGTNLDGAILKLPTVTLVEQVRQTKEPKSKRKQHDPITFLNSLQAQKKRRHIKYQLSKAQASISSRQEHLCESLNVNLEIDGSGNREPESFGHLSHDASECVVNPFFKCIDRSPQISIHLFHLSLCL
jgi:hypothetical protein